MMGWDQGPESVMKYLSNKFEYFISKNLTGKYLANISFASKTPNKSPQNFLKRCQAPTKTVKSNKI